MGTATSVATNGVADIVAKRAVGYHQCCVAAKVCIVVNRNGARVAADGTVVYFQRCETATVSVIVDAAAHIKREIAIDRTINERQPRVVIENTSTVISVAVGDGESGNRYGAT